MFSYRAELEHHHSLPISVKLDYWQQGKENKYLFLIDECLKKTLTKLGITSPTKKIFFFPVCVFIFSLPCVALPAVISTRKKKRKKAATGKSNRGVITSS